MDRPISSMSGFLRGIPFGSRVRFLTLVVLVAAFVTLLVKVEGSAPPIPFSNPPIIESAGGILRATLTVAPAEVIVAGKIVKTTVYNGLYMPPVLKVQPGETIRLRLINGRKSPAPTNVHYHGLGVSPKGHGDNVFIEVDPGDPPFNYNIPIPDDHPQGLFWYHPHFHPGVNSAIAAGLSGGLIIGNILAPLGDEYQNLTERIVLLKDLKLDENGQPVPDPDPAGPTIRTINGLFQPQIEIAPGELQFWRIGNIGANIYYKLRFEEKLPFYIIGIDGNLQNQIIETRELLIPPASRYEVLVRGPKKGKYRLHAEAFNTGPAGDAYPHQLLATLVSRGHKVDPIPLPSVFPPVTDLSELPLDFTRKVVFNDTDDPDVFVIDHKVYDHDRIDQLVRLGDLEEWTVQNKSQELHVFHIHQTDFQVTEINGVRQPFTGYQDTVTLPIATKKGPGEIKIRIPFTNPLIVGKFVYHCHIVQHADKGMMANIEVVHSLAKLDGERPGKLAAHSSHRSRASVRRMPGVHLFTSGMKRPAVASERASP
ncbi:MAG TPA: multicopper oxidase family protein [Candidatus Binatia bacterium]|nr:multicopper oxidase family protein [Candidatus Binatia bacterium]